MNRRTLSITLLSALLAGGCVSLTPYEQIVAELPAENLIEVGGRRAYVEVMGEGDPVLLVHGFGSSAFSWRHVAPELARDFRVIAVDLPGFGFTERPEEASAYTRFAQGEFLIGVADALGVDRFHLVGHSYGGAVCAALAIRSPERIETLTLLNAVGPIYTQARRTRLATVRPITAAFIRTKSLRRKNIERALKRSLVNDELADEELVEEYRRRLAIEGVVAAFRGLTVPIEDPQSPVELSQLRVPTLALWGAEDVLIPVDAARKETAAIEGSRFALIEDAGHAPMEDRPREVARVLRTFFLEGLTAFDAMSAEGR